ncbi:MAG TPA: hypothetical protein VJR46_03010 [Candidatus Dormibacteraeota bacterium]|nr:hypothetical protein [Candidatus Dormibacteraeota bacterium]
MGGRLNWIFAMFAIAVVALLFRHFFATAWSNKCDPGNQFFFLMKNDGVVGFSPQGELFTWENDGPDNSWLCSGASLSVSYVGPNIKDMYDATRANMTANGWVEQGALPNEDFAVYEKVTGGVTLEAVVREQLLWVEVDINAPARHLGENGFG